MESGEPFVLDIAELCGRLLVVDSNEGYEHASHHCDHVLSSTIDEVTRKPSVFDTGRSWPLRSCSLVVLLFLLLLLLWSLMLQQTLRRKHRSRVDDPRRYRSSPLVRLFLYIGHLPRTIALRSRPQNLSLVSLGYLGGNATLFTD